ncbi:hypothetical protein FE848_04200 [Marinobacter sp. 1-3A]|uniref:hypothetical protein n=1 Tax=Marinobacter sp. 1-3A TaxID=2582920 RepID=UPI001907BB1A|nr:hypothetical protein [Marinobacter sp. 1-3A]MBK1872414.1 hypothetical protein [Marinobacter sp. 1-3A]
MENSISEIELILKQRYGVSFTDIGIEGEEWLDRFGDQPLVDAVEAYAAKYGLTPLTSTGLMPSSK